MAQVKFYRGNASDYSLDRYREGIYFSMDEKVLYHNGVRFDGIDLEYFSGATKDFDIDGSTVSFKKLNDNGNWDTVSIELVKAADKSIEIGTITKEGGVTDGFTIGVKVKPIEDNGDGLKLHDTDGLYVDLTKTTAAITANTAKIATNKNAIDANKAAIDTNKASIETLNGADTVNGSVSNKIKVAIEGLDVDASGGDGKVITTISQSDGKVSATAIDLTASNVKATAFKSDDTKVAVTGENVSAQIESLATSIKSVSTAAKTYSITSISGEELTALGTNVKEAYKLVDEKGAKAGEIIKIYNDSSLKSVALNGQTLNFTYILADGSESTVGVDVSTFLAESEFKDGLEVVDHVVNVKKDPTSEPFLTVGADGVKLDGVQNAIDEAAAAAKTKVKLADGTNKITLSDSTADDGSVTYTIGQNDIASATDLANEIAARTAAIEALDLGSVGGADKVITTISQSNGQVSASAIDLTASNVKATASSSSTTAVAVTGETVSAQIESLAKSIKSASTAAAAAHTVVNAKTDGYVKVSVAKSSDKTHDVVTITEEDIASANALRDEISSRQTQDNTIEAAVGLNADGSHVKTSGNYTKDATTVVGEIAALDTKLKEVSDTLQWIDCGDYGK